MKQSHLLSGKQEASNNSLRSLEDSETVRSGQFVFLVSVMLSARASLLAEALFLVFADRRKEQEKQTAGKEPLLAGNARAYT